MGPGGPVADAPLRRRKTDYGDRRDWPTAEPARRPWAETAAWIQWDADTRRQPARPKRTGSIQEARRRNSVSRHPPRLTDTPPMLSGMLARRWDQVVQLPSQPLRNDQRADQRKSWDCGSGPPPDRPTTRSALMDVTPSWICRVPSIIR